MTKVVIIGGGPGGYEAALVGKQLGGDVTVIEREGMGGAAVLTDCVPSKALIATTEVVARIQSAKQIGLKFHGEAHEIVQVDLGEVNQRVMELAEAQSRDIRARLEADGIRIIHGSARLDGRERVIATTADGEEVLPADIILVATGTTPRELPDAPCDGKRILNWKQVYNLDEVPERLIVVGSGVTGAEFASAYDAIGCDVVLVSSRKQVLPTQDQDASAVIQRNFEARGMTIMSECRAVAARCEDDGVIVTLADGQEVRGSHCLMAVGATPNTEGLGLEEAGVALSPSGHIVVDKVSRTSVRNIYAAGDVTGVFALASVAAMQGRVAMWHSLGDAVTPMDLRLVSSNVFTTPEVATVGVTQSQVDAGEVRVSSVLLPLAPNARSKMQSFTDGFVKLFCLPTTGIIIGGVVVAPRASELIHAVSLAVAQRVNVDDFSHVFTVYPSMSGSLAEAARRLHRRTSPLLTN
ncbi:NAD(P)H-quinone dehydrogenase [Tessaracoccus caeni]|uniref:NAD(P)H-quinone dehydrogenase n=1 Tax=Tessaracoccus caeni TaxID=3031239 RepID=UPI0023DC0380|nr:NAD(P)H-quinone dehydrogenase [Tessaracoccus caeni]MDF1488890.1 NAD(P)H-quinone dehydrogenase [Tessaracoccus caeni]